jgi:hypothetical protein
MKKKDKGARGFGFGEIDAETEKFLTPDFDRKRQMGERAVGQVAQVGDGDKLKQRVNAKLEGDDA